MKEYEDLKHQNSQVYEELEKIEEKKLAPYKEQELEAYNEKWKLHVQWVKSMILTTQAYWSEFPDDYIEILSVVPIKQWRRFLKRYKKKDLIK